MRKSPILAALFPDIRGRILAAILARPEKSWYLSELASFLQTRPSSLQREVDTLCHAGLLEQWRDGRRVYLKPNMQSPVYPELKRLFDKTAGVLSILRQELEEVEDRIQLAFLYGSMARSAENSESDVDLMIVGEIGLSELLPSLRRTERILGRPVNPTIFSMGEFTRKARHHDHFLSAVLQGPKQFMKGSEHELEAITGQG